MEEGLIIDAIETGNAAFCTRDHAVLLSNFVSLGSQIAAPQKGPPRADSLHLGDEFHAQHPDDTGGQAIDQGLGSEIPAARTLG